MILGTNTARAHDTELLSLDRVYKDGKSNGVFELDIDMENEIAEVALREPNTTEEKRKQYEPDGYIPVIVSPDQ